MIHESQPGPDDNRIRSKLMKRYRAFLLIALLCSTSALAQQPQATSTTATTAEAPAVRRAQDLIRLVNTGTRAEARAYIKDNFALSSPQTQVEQRLGFFSMLQDTTRGLEYQGVAESKPGE